jgi:hypothetical protein
MRREGADEFPARTDCEEKPRSQKRDLGHPLIFANAKFANAKNEAFRFVLFRAPEASAFVPYRRRSR